jgi:glycosyltransferase involved in cell wall biosynthesis
MKLLSVLTMRTAVRANDLATSALSRERPDDDATTPARLPEVTVIAHAVGVDAQAVRQGGTNIQVAALIEGYLDAGGEVNLICRESLLSDHPRLTVHKLRGPARPFVIASPWFILQASVAVARHGRGLIHSTGALVLGKADIATVHFCHAAYASQRLPTRARGKNIWYRLNAWVALKLNVAMERWCYRPSKTRVLVGPSQGVIDDLAEHFPEETQDIRVIHNGIDHQRFSLPQPSTRERLRRDHGVSDGAFAAIFVGGDWGRKNLRKAIEALAHAPQWHLLVAGDGDQARYQEIADGCGVGSRVIFLGGRSDVEHAYWMGDAFVFPSQYEVAPLVTYEAASCGLPLLVSKINGTEELVVEQQNGWFVSSSDDIARCLTSLADDPALRARMRVAAKQSSAPYTWPSMVTLYKQLYHEMAAHR